MKNTTFRKKALLSSVAMLLVALVALGSATFAWFTQNPTVNANGLSLKATAAAGLQILSDSEKTLGEVFDVETTLNASALNTTDPDGVELGTPVSIDCDVTSAVTFRTTSAALETNYAAAEDEDGNLTISDASADYSETLWLRSSVDSDEIITVKSATVTFTQATGTAAATKLYNAIRVTLVDEDGVIIGTWSPDGIANKYLTATSVSDKDYTKAYKTGVKADMNMSVGYSDNSFVTMLVWLDGEDDVCHTSNVENLKDLVSSINVKFSTK
ncbi:MAG: hypothetical protein IJ331_02215 [Ruminococcus sp.]|nr:hypothetical protein [Ruminococcus sp.]